MAKALLDRNPNPTEDEVMQAPSVIFAAVAHTPRHTKAVLEAAKEVLLKSNPS